MSDVWHCDVSDIVWFLVFLYWITQRLSLLYDSHLFVLDGFSEIILNFIGEIHNGLFKLFHQGSDLLITGTNSCFQNLEIQIIEEQVSMLVRRKVPLLTQLLSPWVPAWSSWLWRVPPHPLGRTAQLPHKPAGENIFFYIYKNLTSVYGANKILVGTAFG